LIYQAEGLKASNDTEGDDDDGERSNGKGGSSEGEIEMEEGEKKKTNATSRKRTHDQSKRKKHGIGIKDRLGPREFDVTMTCDENDEEEVVAEVIQNRLKEPKRHLVTKVNFEMK
jgi:hypothetical protein